MAEAFDFVAIGSGTAAQVAVHQMANAGKRCAVIDYRPYGGTCALRGCDPKKMMVSGEEALAAYRRPGTEFLARSYRNGSRASTAWDRR